MNWINVHERTPPRYEFVLVFADNKGTGEPRPISIAKLDSNGEWEFCNQSPCMPNYGAYLDIEYSMNADDVTHWMPLPDLPNKENAFQEVLDYISENICKENIIKNNKEYEIYYKQKIKK